MNLVMWKPLRGMETLHNRINHLYGDSFSRVGWFDDELTESHWQPVVDIYDNDDTFVINAELPGMSKEAIDIDLKDGVLTLKGERSHENEVKEADYHRRERVFGKFCRTFRLPADIDPHKIKADFKDGVLRIDIPKPEEKKPKKIAVH